MKLVSIYIRGERQKRIDENYTLVAGINRTVSIVYDRRSPDSITNVRDSGGNARLTRRHLAENFSSDDDKRPFRRCVYATLNGSGKVTIED